jgi:hypothetical protein
MKRTARTYPAHLWRVIANDPPLDPIGIVACTRGLPRDIAEILCHFHTQPVGWTTGTRFEAVVKAGWDVERNPNVDADDFATYMQRQPNWEQRGGIWYNHVAKARLLDDELIVLINYAAVQAATADAIAS